jgi:hypothetical protein
MWIPGFASASLQRSSLLDRSSIIDQPTTRIAKQAIDAKMGTDMVIIVDFFILNS